MTLSLKDLTQNKPIGIMFNTKQSCLQESINTPTQNVIEQQTKQMVHEWILKEDAQAIQVSYSEIWRIDYCILLSKMMY